MTQAIAGRNVLLWGRDETAMKEMALSRENARRLPGARFAEGLIPTADIALACASEVILLSVPTQKLRALVSAHRELLEGCVLIACCKGVETGTGLLPTQIIEDVLPGASVGMLTGPSFAADIAKGKPTALTLAIDDASEIEVQELLSTPTLRLYLSNDLIGAQLGGALKNVVAIAAGIVIGAGLGDSARSALMTRAFAEMTRYTMLHGGRSETMFGLSGFGDLVLTCTSTQSRNFRYGMLFGAGDPIPEGWTVEGATTVHAVVEAFSKEVGSAEEVQEVLPVTSMVAALLSQTITVQDAIELLLSRPLRRE